MNEVIDTMTAPEIFLDGVHDIKIVEGVVRIAMFTRQDSTSTIAVRLVIPASELPDVIQAFVKVLTEAMRPTMRMSIGQLSH